jgi:AP2-associated kinase
MRRGRPTAPSQQASTQQPKPQAQVTKGDPFAALDSKSPPATGAPAAGEVDEFASRFPPLDQFSLLHDHGSKFDFDSSEKPLPPSEGVGNKVTERLADEVFASSRQNTPPVSRPQSVTPAPRPKSVTPAPVTGSRSSQYGEPIVNKSASSQQQQAPSEVSRAQSIISSNPELQAMTSQITSRYVSTGTSTDDLPYEPSRNSRRVAQMPAPEIIRPASVPQSSNLTGDHSQVPEPRLSVSARINSLQSQPQARQTASASPSLEAVWSQPPDLIDVVPRTNISVNRSRPVSTNLDNSTIDYLREKEAQARPQGRPTPSPRPLSQVPSPNLIPLDDDNETKAETSDLEFLRSMEDPKPANKRSSLTSLSGSKNMLAGRFGDAFKRFEASNPPQQQQQQSVDLAGVVRSPSPIKDASRRDLTPIAGSEATDGRSDDGQYEDDMDNMTPEQRRDAEQRKLEEEEQRVKAAQEEYRKRVAEGGSAGSVPLPRSIGGVPRASSIQNRVQSLLNEEQKPTTVQRTAQGYGKYTDESPAERRPKPEITRKPIAGSKPQISGSYAIRGNNTGSSNPPALPPKPTGGKPVAPKKPGYLNSLPTGSSPTKTRPGEQLVATDLAGQPALDMSSEDKDNYIRDFTQRFPSLSAMDASERSGSRS